MRDVLKGKHRQGDAQSHLHRYQRLSFFLWTTTENNHIRPLPDSSPPPPPRNWGCQEREMSLPYHAPFPTHWIQPNPYAPPCTHRTLQEDISQTRTSSSGRPTASSHPPPPLSVPETFARSFVSRPKWNPTQETLPLGTNLSHKRTRSGHSFVFRLLSCWAAGASSSPTSQLSDFSHEQAVGRHCLGSASGETVQAPPPSVTACFVFPSSSSVLTGGQHVDEPEDHVNICRWVPVPTCMQNT